MFTETPLTGFHELRIIPFHEQALAALRRRLRRKP